MYRITFAILLAFVVECCSKQLDVKTEINILTKRLSHLEQTNNNLAKSLENDIPAHRDDSSLKQAFSAYLTQNVSYLGGEVIVFDGVTLNQPGNGYYVPSYGYFECPEDGTYEFTLAIASPPGKTSQVMLSVGDQNFMANSKTYMVNVVDVSGVHTSSVVTRCDEGIAVYPVAAGTNQDEVFIIAGLSSFTGYRI